MAAAVIDIVVVVGVIHTKPVSLSVIVVIHTNRFHSL